MVTGIFLVSLVIMLCILAEKFSDRFGMPALILFMFIGMLFGSDGLLKIPFDNFQLTEEICSIALIFIMFYGGFNTKWKLARPVAGKSILLSTAGVVITATTMLLLCHFLLGFTFMESFIIGAVLSSTDAASVFSILRKKKLNLKDGTASILELESGSNDPVSYLLTTVGICIAGAGSGMSGIPVMVLLQVISGIFAGVLLARLSIFILMKTSLVSEGLDTIFMIAMVLLCYGLTSVLRGNVFLSIYIMGILIGNSGIRHKSTLIPFFDGVTSLAQILIFFLLGLLTFPHEMPAIVPTAIIITIILTIIARPLSIFLLLLPAKCSPRQCLLISWAGLRGASSSVFAIMAAASGVGINATSAANGRDLFHIVFMVSLFSAAVQGTLLPWVSHRLDMVDDTSDVRKTFNDYQEDADFALMRVAVPSGHHWQDKKIRDIQIPNDSLAIMIKRNEETIIPKGDTRILAGDNVIISVPSYTPSNDEKLEETPIGKSHPWCGKAIHSLNVPKDTLIAMILRGNETIIPDGNTVILENDIVVMYH